MNEVEGGVYRILHPGPGAGEGRGKVRLRSGLCSVTMF